MLKTLIFLAAAAFVAAGPIMVTGQGSWGWESHGQGLVQLQASGTDGVDSVSFYLWADYWGTAAPPSLGGYVQPFCSSSCGEASINGVTSGFFAFSMGDTGYLRLLSPQLTSIAEVPIVGWMSVRTSEVGLGYSQGSFAIVSPEPGTWALAGAGLLLLALRKWRSGVRGG